MLYSSTVSVYKDCCAVWYSSCTVGGGDYNLLWAVVNLGAPGVVNHTLNGIYSEQIWWPPEQRAIVTRTFIIVSTFRRSGIIFRAVATMCSSAGSFNDCCSAYLLNYLRQSKEMEWKLWWSCEQYNNTTSTRCLRSIILHMSFSISEEVFLKC